MSKGLDNPVTSGSRLTGKWVGKTDCALKLANPFRSAIVRTYWKLPDSAVMKIQHSGFPFGRF